LDSSLTSDIQYRGEQVTGNDDTVSSDDGDESSQLYDLATSILQECKDTTPLSDLNTAIYLFHDVLNRRPAPHPLRSASLKDLVRALMTRFNVTNQRQDLDQAILWLVEVVCERYGVLAGFGGQSQLDVCQWSQSDPNSRIYQLRRGIFSGAGTAQKRPR